ncbi:cytochrome P450 [Tanacetum coccineum]
MDLSPMSPELPWTRVERRQTSRKNHHATPTNNPTNDTRNVKQFQTTNDQLTITFHFTNFPSNWTQSTMFEVFKRYGNVRDVFIPNKRNKLGKRFGFSKFVGVFNPTAFEKKLNTICIGTQRLSCNIAHHQRNTDGLQRSKDTQHFKPSYASMLSHNKSTSTRHKIHLPLPSTPSSEHLSSIFIELKSLDGATNLHNIILDEGFTDFDIKYLGGLCLQIQFRDATSMENAISNRTFLSLFKSISAWNNNYRITNHVTWLNISGLPPQAWLQSSFAAIAKL